MPNGVDIYQNIAPRFLTGTWKTNADLKQHQRGHLERVTESRTQSSGEDGTKRRFSRIQTVHLSLQCFNSSSVLVSTWKPIAR